MMKSALVLLALCLLMLQGSRAQDNKLTYMGTACEGTTFEVRCPENYHIRIDDVFFGRDDTTTCLVDGRDNNVTDCEQPSAFADVKRECDNKQSCDVRSSSIHFGTPPSCRTRSGYAPISKYLKIRYTCDQTKYYAVLCEGSGTVEYGCDSGIIDTLHAFWGRWDSTTCPHETPSLNRVTNCSSSQAPALVSKLCDGRRTCALNANTMNFGEPCNGTYKYLWHQYTCADCVNSYGDDDQCEEWACWGECEKENSRWMYANCRKACSRCDGTEKAMVNVDPDANCRQWAQDGKCEERPCFMHRYCRMSCGSSQRGIEIEYQSLASYSAAQCDQWADDGECQANPDFMFRHCLPSCNYAYDRNVGSAMYFQTNFDFNGTQCQFWAGQGECDNNPAYMLSLCSKTCLNFTTEKFNYLPCENYIPNYDGNVDEQCLDWFNAGEMETNPVWMFYHCPKACTGCYGYRSCVNYESDAACELWTRWGEAHTNSEWMVANCYKEVSQCGKPRTPNDCKNLDLDWQCDAWALRGDCRNETLRDHMFHYCCMSCTNSDIYYNRPNVVGQHAVPGDVLFDTKNRTLILAEETSFSALQSDKAVLTHFSMFTMNSDPFRVEVWNLNANGLVRTHSQLVRPLANTAQSILPTVCVEVDGTSMLGFSAVNGSTVPIAYRFTSDEAQTIYYQSYYGTFHSAFFPYTFSLNAAYATGKTCLSYP